MYLSDEEAKAAQEVAKVGGKIVDSGNDLGNFLSKFIEGPLMQISDICQDKLSYIRSVQGLKLKNKFEGKREKYKLAEPDKKIPAKLVVPLIQAATLEEDEYIQELWANLLLNSSYIETDVQLERFFIDVLERLSPLEARILIKLYSISYSDANHDGICTKELPDKISLWDNKIEVYDLKKELKLILSNLDRLGCIRAGLTYGGKRYDRIYQTESGNELVRSCTLNFETSTSHIISTQEKIDI